MEPHEYAQAFRTLLQEYQDPIRAQKMSAYMKGHFAFFGVMSTPRKEALRSFTHAHGLPKGDALTEVVRSLWNMPERELQYCSQELAYRGKLFRSRPSLETIKSMITHKSWWDTVDYIASNLCGGYFKAFPDEIPKVIPRWSASGGMWLIRSSILFQLKYKEHVDIALLTETIKPHTNSSEFFIQKAIGWALREVSKTDPAFVEGVIASYSLKPLSIREAKKYL